ncbi:MAG: hypothetical protein H6725_11530 [Sandaracinaceae bacterium]|nr:hypothetical protein [Sandaracinaceae bacterium]
MDILLGLLGALCCLVLPALLLSAPLAALGVRAIRERPEQRARWIVGLSFANACVSGAALTIAGLTLGMGVASEDAGMILNWLVSVGCGGGLLSGFLVTALVVTAATRTHTPAASGATDQEQAATRSEERKTRSARRMAVAAAVLFVVGVATTLVGTVFAFTIGMISLALAAVSVRPLALVFVAAHLLGLALAAHRYGGSPERKRAAGAALALSALGVLMASLIAGFGPGFFHSLVSAAADVLTR